jgi:hypothetical protein
MSAVVQSFVSYKQYSVPETTLARCQRRLWHGVRDDSGTSLTPLGGWLV